MPVRADPPAARSSATADQDLELLKIYMDVYQHHFGLFLQGVLLYFMVVGGMAGYAFREATSSDSTKAVCCLAVIFSIVTIACTIGLVRWTLHFRVTLRAVQARLGEPGLSFVAAFTCLISFLVATTLIAAVGLLTFADRFSK